jgi:hypothetical protein
MLCWLTESIKTGTCQERSSWREYHGSDYEWEVGDGDVAGDLVSGVSGGQAYEEGGCDDSGREDVTGGGGRGFGEDMICCGIKYRFIGRNRAQQGATGRISDTATGDSF